MLHKLSCAWTPSEFSYMHASTCYEELSQKLLLGAASSAPDAITIPDTLSAYTTTLTHSHTTGTIKAAAPSGRSAAGSALPQFQTAAAAPGCRASCWASGHPDPALLSMISLLQVQKWTWAETYTGLHSIRHIPNKLCPKQSSSCLQQDALLHAVYWETQTLRTTA